MVTCSRCGMPFRAKRATARYCSPTCRWRAFQARDAAPGDAPTLRGLGLPALSVGNGPEPAPATAPGVIELGRLDGDTIPDRRWRIVAAAGAFTLQCDALVPGGWMNVAAEPTMLAVRRFAAWLALTIEPVAIGARPELIAA
jgi:hypothetical protein